MDQRERISDVQEAIRTAIDGLLWDLWVALPGTVQAYDRVKNICTIQPTVKIRYTNPQGDTSWLTMPLLTHVPVVYYCGGAFAVTTPIQVGDEALVIFSSRCIDNWWLSGGIQEQPEIRRHSLSDGFAFIGPRSQPNTIKNISDTSIQIRTMDGSAFIELTKDGKINLNAPGGVNVTGAVTATGDGMFNGHSVTNHTHTDPQGGQTGTAIG